MIPNHRSLSSRVSAKTSLNGVGRIEFWLGFIATSGDLSPCEFCDDNIFVLPSQMWRYLGSLETAEKEGK